MHLLGSLSPLLIPDRSDASRTSPSVPFSQSRDRDTPFLHATRCMSENRRIEDTFPQTARVRPAVQVRYPLSALYAERSRVSLEKSTSYRSIPCYRQVNLESGMLMYVVILLPSHSRLAHVTSIPPSCAQSRAITIVARGMLGHDRDRLTPRVM